MKAILVIELDYPDNWHADTEEHAWFKARILRKGDLVLYTNDMTTTIGNVKVLSINDSIPDQLGLPL
jgi:hypothetical protein